MTKLNRRWQLTQRAAQRLECSGVASGRAKPWWELEHHAAKAPGFHQRRELREEAACQFLPDLCWDIARVQPRSRTGDHRQLATQIPRGARDVYRVAREYRVTLDVEAKLSVSPLHPTRGNRRVE